MSSEIILTNEATPSTPATGKTTIFVNSSKILSYVNDAGSVINLGSSLSASPITASLGADVLLNNTANFFDGPSVAQGTSGTWFVSGTITVKDTAGAAFFIAKLWDGTTLISSTRGISRTGITGDPISMSLSGYIASPAGNLRISVKDTTSTSGVIVYNDSGLLKDSTITAFRIA